MTPGPIAAPATTPSAPLTKEATGGFRPRALARIIDILVGQVAALAAGVVAGIVLSILEGIGLTGPGWMQRIEELSTFSMFGWGLAAGIFYETVSESVGGTTLGKLMLGLRVVTTDLQPCTTRGAFIRSVAFLLDGFFFGMIGYSAMAGSPLNQRFGDQWGRTIVARANALPASARRSGGVIALGIFGGVVAFATCSALGVIGAVL